MNILFAKSNNHRKKEFRIDTMIIENGAKTLVKKYIKNQLAQNHLEQYATNMKIIRKGSKNILFPKILTQNPAFLEIEYMDFPSLELLIEQSLIEKNFSNAGNYVSILQNTLNNIDSVSVSPYDNAEFRLNFDPESKYFSGKKEDCCKLGILDINFDNLLMDNHGKVILIDSEWIFNIPIPKKFILFRTLFYLCNQLQSVIATYCSENFPCYEVLLYFLIPIKWFDVLKLSQNEVKKYLYYENEFQNKIKLINHGFDPERILKRKTIIKRRYSLSLEHYLNRDQKEKTVEIGPKFLYMIEKYYELKNFLIGKKI